MSELVYPPVITAAKTMFRVLDLRLTIDGAKHVPTSGGAVLASNHLSYLDFIFAGFAAHPARRLVRFMCKDTVFRHWLGGPLMRGMHHIPVDRDNGLASYKAALEALKDGQVVGVFPEATISTSFMIKEMKTGAARMASSTGTPILPVILWGTQRMWTKGRPRNLTQRHLPITILVGEPLAPDRRDDRNLVTKELQNRMGALLDRAQREYPAQPSGPDDTWWLPAHLGGTAPAHPTPAPETPGDS
jgi:1-acyl-sn-glycerol-3-phosphate acyltransferase